MSHAELTILVILSRGDSYGLTMPEKAAQLGGAPLRIGGLYTTLSRMEAKKLVASRWGDDASLGARRRYYVITSTGRAALKATAALIRSAKT